MDVKKLQQHLMPDGSFSLCVENPSHLSPGSKCDPTSISKEWENPYAVTLMDSLHAYECVLQRSCRLQPVRFILLYVDSFFLTNELTATKLQVTAQKIWQTDHWIKRFWGYMNLYNVILVCETCCDYSVFYSTVCSFMYSTDTVKCSITTKHFRAIILLSKHQFILWTLQWWNNQNRSIFSA